MVKAKKVEEAKVWEIGVVVDSDSWTIREGDGIQYSDHGETGTSWHVQGLKLIEEGKSNNFSYRERVDVNFEPKKGQLYHLLYAVYSTGDSFSHAQGACFEVVGLYKSRKVAEENEKRLNERTHVGKGRYGFEYVILKFEGTTKPHTYNPPWDGYFESLDRLEVLSLVLN